MLNPFLALPVTFPTLVFNPFLTLLLNLLPSQPANLPPMSPSRDRLYADVEFLTSIQPARNYQTWLH